MMTKHSGQSLMIIAIVMAVLMMGAAGYSLIQMNAQNTEKTMTYKQQTQSYLLAKSGVDEALSTRLIPRSNQLSYRTNFNPVGFVAQGASGTLRNTRPSLFGTGPYEPVPGFNTNIYAFYRDSGISRQDIQNPNSAVTGFYRYIVIGGDPARKAIDGSYFNINNPGDYNPAAIGPNYNQLVENEFFRTDSTPFVVISNGFTCVTNGGMNTPGAVVVPATPLGQPTCAAGFIPDQTTLVTPVSMETLDPTALAAGNRASLPDQTGETRVYKNGLFQLPRNFNGQNMMVFVPGFGLRPSGQNLNFQQMWNANNVLPSRLNAIVFFNSATRQTVGRPIVFCNGVTGCPTGFSNNPIYVNSDAQTVSRQIQAAEFQVPSNASIKLYYDGAIDYRSPYNYQINGTNATGQNCSSDRQLCKIHLSDSNLVLNLRDFNFLTLFPSNTQVLVSPTYEPGDFNRLIISGMRDYSGKVDGPTIDFPRTYDIRFFVNN